MSTGTSCHFGHLCSSLKQISLKSDFIPFFHVLYMYIAPGQGQTASRGQSVDVNRNVLSLRSFVASLKKNVFEVNTQLLTRAVGVIFKMGRRERKRESTTVCVPSRLGGRGVCRGFFCFCFLMSKDVHIGVI